MTSSDLTHKNEKVTMFEGLVKHLPNIEQMRDPIKMLWNTDLAYECESENAQLLKLIDFSQLNDLFENFLAAIGLPVAIIDLNGTVLASSKWQRLCVEFHRSNADTLSRCIESDRCIYAQLKTGEVYASHQCGNGLIDCATPIVIEGLHLANLFIGQFFIQPPNLDFFKQQQQLFGFDEIAYFEAIAEVPVINEERLPLIMALLAGWAQQIAARSLAEKRTLVALSSVEQLVKKRTEQLAQSHALLQTAQHAARASEERFRTLFTKAPLGIAVIDSITGHIYNANQKYADIVGLTIDELQSIDWMQITHPDDIQADLECMALMNAGKTNGFSMEKRYIRPDGSVVWINLTVARIQIHERGHPCHHCIIEDITARKISEEHIKQLASYDPLTQLANRRLLQERLKQGIEVSHRAGSQMAVLILDLDKFKTVNDNLGHAVGDELLQQVAKRIKVRLREIDLVARLGGDEFVVLIEDVSHYEYVAYIANDIIDALSQPFTLRHNHDVIIGTSIGIAMYPQHGDTAEVLMDNADTALYHAKDSGRGCFAYFSDELTQKTRKRIDLEKRLRRAIEQKELRVYFQPQIDIHSGQIVGAEALIRWYDPIEGCLTPNSFIALAEETGLIVTIGEWVLRETCRLGQQWRVQGLPPVTLAVNVSPCQFRRCDMNALVTKVLRDTGFPVEYLELEITESGLMDNQQYAMTILNNLHEQGVHIAIDDFGTGYSSLAYLKYFPVDVLKIDKTFIDDIPYLQGDMAITATIITMAHHLGFKVLAEGVETQEQLAFLREQGCDNYQGYLYSPALPADAFAKLLADTLM